MPVRIRTARLSDREEVPLHWESCRLKRFWRAVGGVGGALAVLGGIAGMVLGQGSLLEPAGAALGAAGAAVLVLLIRCRTWTTSVGREWIRTGAGPFTRMLPVGTVDHVRVRPATGVRCFFAASEVVLELSMSGETVPIPSTEPEELGRAIGGENRSS